MKHILLTIVLFALSIFSASTFAAGDYNLENVTGDATIRGITTPSDATGHASIDYKDGEFTLKVSFKNIADPLNDDFYEGWLVQKSPFKFISTGELEKVDGVYMNNFTSDIDYSSYDFYVLTLEPNDGDPAPADHIVEGAVMKGHTMMKDEMEDKMMKKENPKRKLLRSSVQKRLSNINLSVEKINIVLDRIENLEEKLPTLRISDTKKEQYVEILSVLKEILSEKKAGMMSDAMMEK